MKFIKYTFFVVSILLSQYSYAIVYCNTLHGKSSPIAQIQGLPTISVTPGLPVGQRLFSGRFMKASGESNATFSCGKDADGAQDVHLIMRAEVTNGTAIDNTTFQTNIPGIGVQFWINSGYITADGQRIVDNFNEPGVQPGWSGSRTQTEEMSFFLVKTGEVQPGQVNGVSFPTVTYTWEDNGTTGSLAGVPYNYARFSFTGRANITVPSCTTPGDFEVNIGSYNISTFRSDGVTPWKNVGLKLTNCPSFTGYGSSDTQWDQTLSSSGGGAYVIQPGDVPEYTSNKLEWKLDPVYGAIDVAKGIFNIDSGASSAKGVALQIASGDTGSNIPVLLGTPVATSLSKEQSPQTIDIPLVVRMIKTDDDVRSGLVTSKITYLINYK